MKHLHAVPYFLIVFFTVVMIITATVVYAAPPTQYKEVATTGNDLNGKVFVDSDATGFNTYLEDGFIIISGHGQKTVKLKWIALKNSVKTLNGHTIKVQHRNDAGVIDSSVTYDFDAMEDNQGFVYFDADFSEVIIGGFVGLYTKTDSTVYNNMTNFSYGQSLTNMSSVTVNVTPGYDSALSKYDYIASLNPVGWWKADGNANDSSGYGNNGTLQGDANTTAEGKYNSSFGLDGNGDYITVAQSATLNQTDFISLVAWVNVVEDKGQFIIGKSYFGAGMFSIFQHPAISGRWAVNYESNNLYAPVNSIKFNTTQFLVATYNKSSSSDNIKFYIDGVKVNEADYTEDIFNADIQITLGAKNGGTDRVNGWCDNYIIFDFELNQSQINNLYYDPVQELRVRTNSNSTWSNYWNSTADDGLAVPFGAGESLTYLQKSVPTQATVNGVITRDYNTTAQFSMSSTVHGVYYENVTKVTESTSNNVYNLQINHTPAQYTTGIIPYTTANADLLNADFTNPATLSTNNPNASLSSTLPDFTVNTGYVASGVEYYYLIQQPYFYPPANLATTVTQSTANVTWTASPNADKYSIYQKNKSIFWTDETITIDGIETESSWADAQRFILPSPNPVNVDDYDSIAGLHDANNFYVLVNAVDRDSNTLDDRSTLYGDFLNDGLTTDDRAWQVRENGHIYRYKWDGDNWAIAPGSAAVAAVTGAGTSTITAEFSIPISELGANFTNGSFMPMLWERECAALNPDVYTYHPTDNINNTDVSLWEHVGIEAATSGHIFLANTTNLYYNVTGLDVFEWYNFGVSAWNGSQETSDDHVSGVTLDLTEFLVSGYILDASGTGIESAIVWAQNGLVAGVEQTNASGYYERNLYAANYTFYANKSGYHTNSISVSVSGNLTNQNITLSVYSNADLWAKLLEIEALLDIEETAPTEITKMTYQIFILLIIIDLLAVWYSFTHIDKSYYTDVITSLLSVIISAIVAYNSVIGVSYYFATQSTVHEIEYTSISLMILFSSVSLVMLIFFIAKILELTHKELE